MYFYYLTCDCGYASAEAWWGAMTASRCGAVAIPIYNPETGILSTHELPAEGEGADDPAVWHLRYMPQIRSRFGDKAFVLIPGEYNVPILNCPRCGRISCQAVSTGIG